ncbi:Cytidylate kinase [Desulfamplus magnetovallimortis]|uniref:Cytidylate kinase n=1 Tax=Desulfamplus magnetovallimortis TaxID=1246637 RepID=A0A1W1HEN0_9BACT|nr:(d)CMP kinase [Desulfamplus magnetovallimortis]SLM30835.1 Cytidylate kinase [Desulfamplus magnetovallimortis]
MESSKPLIITIDGPAGAGKTTVSKALSTRLGCIYVDTGALYRGVAYEIQRCNFNIERTAEIEDFLSGIELNLKMEKDGLHLYSLSQDITDYIRTPEITMLASSVSAMPAVREKLLGIQRSIAEFNDAVFEGRDMGTIVFPDADYKFFLYADLEIRARRRYSETDKKEQTLDEVAASMAVRDKNDSSRSEAPLKPAADAVMVDSTHMNVEDVVEKMMAHIVF